MPQSQTIGALALALAKAQAQFKPAIKDANNPFFKSKYVDLAGAIDASRDALIANDIAVIQTTDTIIGGLATPITVLTTTLAHKSGEWISGSYPINPVKNDPQGVGSAITYARRYSLMAAIGLAAEDDDGNAASETPKTAPKVASKTGEILKAQPKWTDEQRKEIGSIFADIYRIGGETGEKQVAKLRAEMKYDLPQDVIDAAAALRLEWLDIESKNNG
jgi:hypothetical protein